MTRKKRRLYILLLCGLGLGSATALTLTAFQDNLVFFRSPSDIMREAPPANRAFRLGGLVEAGSLERATGADGKPTAEAVDHLATFMSLPVGSKERNEYFAAHRNAIIKACI